MSNMTSNENPVCAIGDVSYLGRKKFSIGVINRLKLFEHGCHIKTKQHNVLAKWEEIASASFEYLEKHTLNAITSQKHFLFVFHMKNGNAIPVKFIRLGFLWGLEFAYHDWKINKLIKVLAQHTKVTSSQSPYNLTIALGKDLYL